MNTTAQKSFTAQALDSAHQRPALLAAVLFAGVVGGFGLLALVLENYHSIWTAAMYVLSGGGTFWFPVVASLACWAAGITIHTIKGDSAWRQIAPIIIVEALFLAAATLQLSTTPPESLNQIIFIIAAYALPVGIFGGAALVSFAERG